MMNPLIPVQMPHALVVDDDARIRDLLRRYLVEQGFIVTTAPNATDARAKLDAFAYDIVVLDVMMPGETGVSLTRSLRQDVNSCTRQLPIILLTAQGETHDRIAGLEAGADDYLPKPFEPKELLLRINAILRRAPKPALESQTIALGRWTYDPLRDELASPDETVRLSDMEARLMRLLAANPGTALSRETLAEQARAGKGVVNDRTVDVQINRLRRKIEQDSKNPRTIVTVRGEGYMLLPDANS